MTVVRVRQMQPTVVGALGWQLAGGVHVMAEEPGADHPAFELLTDTLRVCSGPVEPEDLAKLLRHALRATGYALVKIEA
jgi:hypothetical protein